MALRLAVALVWLTWTPAALAATFTVTTIADTGTGSLRDAITRANAAAGADVITFEASGTIALATALPPLTDAVVIAGGTRVTIRSTGRFPVLTIRSAVELSGLALTGGQGEVGSGGGVVVESGSLALSDCTLTGNAAPLGSAVYASAALTIRRTTITGNTGAGAIFAASTATVLDSTIAGNTGTAIVAQAAGRTLTLARTTVSGNAGGAGVGGLELRAGTAAIRSSTFSGNTGQGGGDFWTAADGVTLALVNVTAAGSAAPALRFDRAATVTLRNTLLAGAGVRCSAPPTSQGHNVASDASCGLTQPTDQPSVDPRIGPLELNGCSTRTHALLEGSPAIDAGDADTLDDLDQRGLLRVQFAAVDVGAYEVAAPVISLQPASQAVIAGAPLELVVTARNLNSPRPLRYQWRHDGADIPGATAAAHAVAAAVLADAGRYDVVVTNEGGSVTSAAADVTITPADGGGCCSSTGGDGWSAGLALVVAAGLARPRRRRPVPRGDR